MFGQCSRRLVFFCALLLSGPAQARTALLDLNSTPHARLKRDHRVTVAATAGFPGFGGAAVSYWPLGWLSVDGFVEYGAGLFVTAGPVFHLPLVAHGVHRHDFVASSRVGEVLWGSVIYPPFGFYCSAEGGYGYLGENLDVRLLVGLNGVHDHRDKELLWEVKPTLALRVGWSL